MWWRNKPMLLFNGLRTGCPVYVSAERVDVVTVNKDGGTAIIIGSISMTVRETAEEVSAAVRREKLHLLTLPARTARGA